MLAYPMAMTGTKCWSGLLMQQEKPSPLASIRALDIQQHSGLDQMEEALRGRRSSVTGDGSPMRMKVWLSSCPTQLSPIARL
jgi:hypothetical protein